MYVCMYVCKCMYVCVYVCVSMHVCRHDASSNDYQLRPQRFCLRGLKHVPSKRHQHLLLTVCVECGADASRHYQLSSVSPKPFANKLENPHKCIPHPRFNIVSLIGISHVPLLLLTTYTYVIPVQTQSRYIKFLFSGSFLNFRCKVKSKTFGFFN